MLESGVPEAVVRRDQQSEQDQNVEKRLRRHDLPRLETCQTGRGLVRVAGSPEQEAEMLRTLRHRKHWELLLPSGARVSRQ